MGERKHGQKKKLKNKWTGTQNKCHRHIEVLKILNFNAEGQTVCVCMLNIGTTWRARKGGFSKCLAVKLDFF